MTHDDRKQPSGAQLAGNETQTRLRIAALRALGGDLGRWCRRRAGRDTPRVAPRRKPTLVDQARQLVSNGAWRAAAGEHILRHRFRFGLVGRVIAQREGNRPRTVATSSSRNLYGMTSGTISARERLSRCRSQ